MPDRPPADRPTPDLQAQELRTKPAGRAGSGPGSHIPGPQRGGASPSSFHSNRFFFKASLLLNFKLTSI